MPTNPPPTAAHAYTGQKIVAAHLIEQLAAALDVPEPAGLNWNHVGSMTEVVGRLSSLLAFVQGEQ